MTARAARFEICRGDSGYWARFRAANGRVVFVSETYERRRGADNAVHLMARSFWGIASFGYDEIGRLFVDDRGERHVEVREVDER